MNYISKSPVAFFIFKRPDLTQKVFQIICQAKPSVLFVIADGPREDREDEFEKCLATRKIIEQVDWKCEVVRNYSDTNLGCGVRVSSGLDWVFQQANEAILLEDDCVPHPSFFRFCDELLEKYRDDERVMSITGQNIHPKSSPFEHSYYFSRYPHCWGWATWRRAWQHYDFSMKLWPTIRDQNLLAQVLLEQPDSVRFWSGAFQSVYAKQIDTWDYQWIFACWLQSGLNIHSSVNLVSNIGFGTEATHTTQLNSPFNNLPRESIYFPLNHPPFILRDVKADTYLQKTLYHKPVIKRISEKLNRLYAKR